jgi:glutamine synthetase adenylyltransferase
MRSRAIAGRSRAAQALLDATREGVVRSAPPPWPAIADIRRRIERERAETGPDLLAFKTGRGGLIEVDFLGAGALLERGLQVGGDTLPSVPAMLRTAVPCARSEELIAAYTFLRRFEACARWVAGRAVESLRAKSEAAGPVAELVEAGRGVDVLVRRVREATAEIRAAYETVTAAGSIAALE